MQNIKLANKIRLTMKKTMLIFAIILLLFSCKEKDQNTCTISGEVIGYENCTSLLLFKTQQDPRYLSEKIKLDKNNTFKYTIKEPTDERYSLISEEAFIAGNGYLVNFFADNDSIRFQIHSMERLTENKIIGSKKSNLLLDFEKEEKNWLDTDPFGKNDNKDSIMNVFFSNKIDFVLKNQNLVGYSMLIQLFQASQFQSTIDKSELFQIGDIFKNIYPNHPYTAFIETIKKIKVGNVCPQIQAPDKSGEIIDISAIIKNKKLTLIDLWAPWCSPCIEKGKEMIPVYEKYKDSGFGVIGVVGGIKNKESYQRAIKSFNFPWENLIEINNENRIWEKFNIMNSGGATFIIDNTGIILAINPTIEETEQILNEKL